MLEDGTLEDVRDLEGYFQSGAKPPEDWGVGIEYERAGVFAESGRAIPYHGRASLSALLARLVSMDGWRPSYAGEHIIALEKDGVRITVEPGGQLELSGKVHRRLEDLREEVTRFSARIRDHSRPLGIAWLGVGLQPFSSLQEIEWVPKPRYAVMSAHLASTGEMSHRMMKQTAGVQVNLDYDDEADAMEKLRTAMATTTLITALFANSPLLEGKPTGFMSYRAWIWQHTDPARCGLLPFAWSEKVRFRDYLDYALDVPLMFIQREAGFLRVTGLTFRDYLRSGFGNHRATLLDFELHLTTLFPEVRLKRYLEIRGGDSGDGASAVCLVALWKGLLYDAAARREAWGAVSGFSTQERLEFHRQASRLGARARLGRRSALAIGEDLYRIATEGLSRQGEPSSLLDPLAEILFETRGSPARLLQERWLGEWGQEPLRLIEFCGRNTLKPTLSPGGSGAEDY